MRVLVKNVSHKEDERIILECVEMTKDFDEIMEYILKKESVLTGYLGENVMRIRLGDVLYFEAVGEDVFADTRSEVYNIKKRLYELEDQYGWRFKRCSKSMLVNLSMIESLRPEKNARYFARMKNGEDVIVSRMYAKQIRQEFLAG